MKEKERQDPGWVQLQVDPPSWKYGCVPSCFTDEETEAYRLIRSDDMTPTGLSGETRTLNSSVLPTVPCHRLSLPREKAPP